MNSPAETPAARPDAADEGPPTLSLAAFSICLGLLLVVFVFLHPLWEPMDMAEMDENILWSYYPIPLLVLLALRVERKLSRASWALETLKLTIVKFVVTFVFANTMWAFFTEAPGVEEPDAPPAVRVSTGDRPYQPQPSPEPTPPDPARTGALEGRVLDAAGRPVAGALVRVTDGLAGHRWPAPEQPAVVEVSEAGLAPAFTVVRAYQPLLLRATDGVMHTAQATGEDGRMLFNYPVLPGTDRELMFPNAAGDVVLSCRAHETGGAALLVIDHPFATTTDADGGFRLEGVPEGEVVLAASVVLSGAEPEPTAGGTAGPASGHPVTVRAGAVTDVELRL